MLIQHEFLHVIYISLDQPSDIYMYIFSFSTNRRSNNFSTIKTHCIFHCEATIMSPGNRFSKMPHCSVLTE